MLTSRKVMELLLARFPELAGDRSSLLQRVLVVERLPADCSPQRLMILFRDLLAADVVHDDIGYRAGILVFASNADCSVATKAVHLNLRNQRRAFRHLKSLIGVVETICPAATQDPNFLQRSILLMGVSLRTSPRVLREDLNLPVQAAAVVRDIEFGDSVGLIVLTVTDADETKAATAKALSLGTQQGLFCDCIQASQSRYSYNRFQILDALDDRVRRQPTSELLRSLIPPEYLLTDEEMQFHLSCVFLRGPGCSSYRERGVYGLCRMASEVLRAVGPVNAVVVRPDHNVAVLVYPDAQATERVVTKASDLWHSERGNLMMYDSSVFPLPTGPSAEAASLAQRLLPPFVTPAGYPGRVLQLTGIDNPEKCDVEEIAWFLHAEASAAIDLGLYAAHAVEAIIVHRSLGIALVVLRSQEDAEMVLQEPQETWLAAFKTPVVCHLMEPEPLVQQQQQQQHHHHHHHHHQHHHHHHQLGQMQHLLSNLKLGLGHWINPRAYEILGFQFTMFLEEFPDHNFSGLTIGLLGLAALSQPSALRRSYFPDRAVLLTRITCPGESDLRTALTRYGSLDELVHVSHRRIALAIFTSWTGATRLLREPGATRVRWGLGDFRRAEGVGCTSAFADMVMRGLLSYHSRLPPSW